MCGILEGFMPRPADDVFMEFYLAEGGWNVVTVYLKSERVWGEGGIANPEFQATLEDLEAVQQLRKQFR